MSDNESPSNDLAGIDKILESIKTEIKAGLDSVKRELKADLKSELDGIRAEIKSELDNARAKDFGPRMPHAPPRRDFPEIEVTDRESRRKTEDFNMADFSGVEVSGAFEVEIVRADSHSVSVSGEDELFRNLDVSKDGERLRISHARHIGWRAQITRPRVRITLPLLRELRLSGATKASVSGFSSSEAFKLEVSGASSLSGEMIVGNAEIELSGASRARLTGSAGDVVIEGSGANHMDLSGLSVRNAAVRLSGASHLTIRMDGRLDAKLGGVSHLGLIGDPVMGNIRTSGASRLSKE